MYLPCFTTYFNYTSVHLIAYLFGMFTIQKITLADYIATGEMIQATITTSRNSYPPNLLKIFRKKYTPNLMKERAHTMDIRIAKQDDIIIGCIALKEDQLKTFFVTPHMQGKGIWSKLYYYLEEKAKEKGIKKLRLEGSTRGKEIYQHFWFQAKKTIHKERLGIKYTDTLMEKILST